MEITIPPLARYSRIGEVFRVFIDVVHRTRSDRFPVWTFGENGFHHPFLIGLLGLYRHSIITEKSIEVDGGHLQGYLNTVGFTDFKSIADAEDAKRISTMYEGKSYLPFCHILFNAETSGSIQTVLENTITTQTNLPKTLRSTLSYLTGELVDNIIEHSGKDEGVLFSQYLRRENCLNICIADFGNTIYGAYLKHQPPQILGKVNGSEGEALRMAMEGVSTKNLGRAETRGFGLSTSKRILGEGLGGGFFIMSGGAFHSHDARGSQTIDVQKMFRWEGTVVLLKIPLKEPQGFGLKNYLQ